MVVDGNDDKAIVGANVGNSVGFSVGVGGDVGVQVSVLQTVISSQLQACIATSNLYPSGHVSMRVISPLVHKAYSIHSGRGR